MNRNSGNITAKAPQEEFTPYWGQAGVVAWVESLRGRQVEGLFESLLSESFGWQQ